MIVGNIYFIYELVNYAFGLDRWLLETFTLEKDHVLDIFAGCGGLGKACANGARHCLCMEGDFFVYNECLTRIACAPTTFEE